MQASTQYQALGHNANGAAPLFRIDLRRGVGGCNVDRKEPCIRDVTKRRTAPAPNEGTPLPAMEWVAQVFSA